MELISLAKLLDSGLEKMDLFDPPPAMAIYEPTHSVDASNGSITRITRIARITRIKDQGRGKGQKVGSGKEKKEKKEKKEGLEDKSRNLRGKSYVKPKCLSTIHHLHHLHQQ